ncbi:MAG: hypothetical protein ACHBN1_03670 [Heteroscytonema crispum UTEX LB 1556]
MLILSTFLASAVEKSADAVLNWVIEEMRRDRNSNLADNGDEDEQR